jgi:cytochrome c oxidase cbb3-type subunit III
MTSGWNWFIVILTLANIAGALWLLFANATAPAVGGNDTGHVWDEDLRDANNPLPRWWFWLFVLSTIWGLAYLFLYPGLGDYAGSLGWNQATQYAREVQIATTQQAPRYARFAAMGLPELARDPDALGEARRLFANGCANCHGSDARGAIGFPNLADSDWLYGNTPEDILATITDGRTGVMPAWGMVLGEDGVNEVVAYVQRLSGQDADVALAGKGAARFAAFCVACHGADGRGMAALGAPNLTDTVWLHGGDAVALRTSIAEGRQNQMPAHAALLGQDRVRLLAAYVLSLRNTEAGGNGRASD